MGWLRLQPVHFTSGSTPPPIEDLALRSSWHVQNRPDPPNRAGQSVVSRDPPRKTSSEVLFSSWVQYDTPPAQLTWNLKMEVWFRWFSFSNRWFSGSMWVFGSVLLFRDGFSAEGTRFVTVTMKTAWLREEWRFILVSASRTTTGPTRLGVSLEFNLLWIWLQKLLICIVGDTWDVHWHSDWSPSPYMIDVQHLWVF